MRRSPGNEVAFFAIGTGFDETEFKFFYVLLYCKSFLETTATMDEDFTRALLFTSDRQPDDFAEIQLCF